MKSDGPVVEWSPHYAWWECSRTRQHWRWFQSNRGSSSCCWVTCWTALIITQQIKTNIYYKYTIITN